MRPLMILFALLVPVALSPPALAQSCDTRCDIGEVWTDAEGGTCIPESEPEPKTS